MDDGRQTMDFFGHQERARTRSTRLVMIYIVAVVLICAAVAAVAGVAYAITGGGTESGPPAAEEIAVVVALAAGLTALLIAGGTAFRVSELRSGGGEGVARALGGRLIDPSTTDPNERRVLNVVEEVAIASGVPVPPVYMMRDEKGINAFAAGYRPGDAVIGVTRGCVEGLTRDELQGVMAHEFSHILNGDMRLNIRLIGLLSGIVLISLIGHTMLRAGAYSGGGRRSKEGGGAVIVIMLMAVAMLVVGSIGALAARMIQASVSRQREFLADAAAVQFTRNPSGIANALRRIGGAKSRARVAHPRAQEAGHMFFGEASGSSSFGGSLASHPPLKVRIKRIDPSWDGTMLTPLSPGEDHGPVGRVAPMTPRERLQRAAGRGPAPEAAEHAELLLPLLALAGQATPDHVEHARSLILAIPEPLRRAAHETWSGRAVVYALLLDPKDASVRDAQIRWLDEHADPEIASLVRTLAPAAVALDRGLRLPLLDMTLGSLAHMSDGQHRLFRSGVKALIEMDKSVSLFEWVTIGVLTRHLDERFGAARPRVVQYYALGQLGGEVSVLLSAIAYAGTRPAADDAAAEAAFQLGAERLAAGKGGVKAVLIPRDQANLNRLDAALTELAGCAPRLKREVLAACALTAAADHAITTAEAELVRAVADTLGVPTPPLLPGQKLV
jgi:Zn-dependent protease with chaperone function